MTVLCWIDVPDGWRCEIKTSDGVVRPWDRDRPIASTCKFRAWDPRRPRDPADDPWMLPGEYDGPTTAEHRADVNLAEAENQARFARPKYVQWTVDERTGKKKHAV
jgi:hypothetical protein